MTYFLLCSTVQHNRRPNDTVVTFVEVAVVGRIKVCEDKHCLKISVISISKLLDIVCHYARDADVLNRKNHKTVMGQCMAQLMSKLPESVSKSFVSLVSEAVGCW